MITINVFSVIDLLAVIISGHVLLVFAYRSLRLTKRRIDFVFTAMMAVVCTEGFFVLASDNVVPAGVLASTIPDAAARTLFWYRLMYIAGTFLMAAVTHFALRYCEQPTLLGRRILWLYAGALAVVPLYFTEGFLAARTTPIRETSGWACAVPWQPESGPWSAVFLALWLAVNVYVQRLLWRRRRAAGFRGLMNQHSAVWVGITLWGIAGLVSVVLGASGYAGVDPSMFLITGAMVVLAVGLAEDHIRSETERKLLTRRFQSYVDPALVKYVVEHPHDRQIASESRELTVVFTDLEGFTTLAERMREEAVQVLNDYLKRMVPLISAHRGYRNKFIGDGMMFFYGAPERDPGHAPHAVETVLQMQEAMVTYNAHIAQRYGMVAGYAPVLAMRAGVSSGQMVVGDAGPEEASDYTVLGDTVNLGARLESANKVLGTRILLSERTAELLPPGQFLLRPVGLIQVAGLSRAVMTYEPLAAIGAANAQHRKIAEIHQQLVGYFVARDFARCRTWADTAEAELGPRKLTGLYRELSERYLRTPPGPDFAGQIVLSVK